jgi:hypothetical protein
MWLIRANQSISDVSKETFFQDDWFLATTILLFTLFIDVVSTLMVINIIRFN